MSIFINKSFKKRAEYIMLLFLYPFCIAFDRFKRLMTKGNVKSRRITAVVLTLALVFTMVPLMSFTTSALLSALDEYPYAIGDTSDTVTLKVDTVGTAYQWQIADTKDGNFENINDANEAQLELTTPEHSKWYRCVIDDAPTQAVQLLQPEQSTIPFLGVFINNNDEFAQRWYVSNGAMAYALFVNDSFGFDYKSFEVAGLYTTPSGDDFWISGSYRNAWETGATTETDPEKIDAYGNGGSDSYANENFESLKLTFDKDNQSDVLVTAKLAEGYRSGAIGTDTMMGMDAISHDYADECALKAFFNPDGTLKHIQMVGAKSLQDALDTDPSFVLTPITQPDYFWIGYYYDRCAYGFNESTENTVLDEHGRVVEIFNEDSGLALSWTGLESGAAIKFKISIGSVSATGAVVGNTTVTDDKITAEVEDGFYYRVVDTAGNPVGTQGWILPNTEGEVIFENLLPESDYKLQSVQAENYNNGEPSEYDIATIYEFITKEHIHNWQYKANGATVTAQCKSVCDYAGTDKALTVIAPEKLVFGDEKSAEATLSATTFAGQTELPTINYVGRADTDYSMSVTAPTNAGKYTAQITVDGKTASVDYEISKATLSGITFPTIDKQIPVGTKLSEISLPDGFTWDNPDDTVKAGKNDYGMTYTDFSDNAANYQPVKQNVTVSGKTAAIPTGDSSNIGWMIAVMLVSIIGLGGIAIIKKREQE